MNSTRKPTQNRIRVSLGMIVGLSSGLTQQGCNMRATPDWSDLKRSIRAEFPGVHQLTTEELADWLNDTSRVPPILLDARSQDEYALSHLRNAHLATDYQAAVRDLGKAMPSTPIVVYCSVGYRSSRLAKELTSGGFSNISNLEGSIFEWANEERPLYRGFERVYTVHPYDGTWGRLLISKFRADPPDSR